MSFFDFLLDIGRMVGGYLAGTGLLAWGLFNTSGTFDAGLLAMLAGVVLLLYGLYGEKQL